ncbi:MAG TPA: di-heme oxidoredictase family protein [Candidatus Angelobacter sp.]|nr:di-heme oxidoredictase family protein [Candidatus Angelobacter sp.]
MNTSTAKLMRCTFVCATMMVLLFTTVLHAQSTSPGTTTTTTDTTGSTSTTTSTFTTFTTTDTTTTTASDAGVDTSLPAGVSTAAQVFDPGPRPGAPTSGAGHPIENMPIEQTTFWVDGLIKFGTTVTPKGANDSSGNPTLFGLGPSFNGESCLQCHSQPNIGGTSPQNNPQFTAASDHGATNTVPIFLSTNGPIREARFVQNADGSLDGGVHELFTIQGRDDAPAGCQISQPDFQTQVNNNNVIFRIPIATFGEGFVENTTDQAFQANLASLAGSKVKRGIRGRFNTNGNDGTVTKFGWKAQNKSMLLFAGEAANVELGMTNEIFTNEKTVGKGCTPNFTPEDNTHVIVPVPPPNSTSPAGDDASEISSNIENFAIFMRLNAPANQCDFQSGQDSSGNALCNPLGASARNGKAIFGTLIPQVVNGVVQPPKIGIGCVLCHADTFTTNTSNIPQLSNVRFAPFSDYALHHMGSNLTDGVNQGVAGPDEFRSAPLWGIGQRIFFMHDGRDSNIVQAILDHESPGNVCTTVNSVSETITLNGQPKSIPSKSTQTCGSEANAVIEKFRTLTTSQKQDLIDFLRSL